MNPEIQWRRGEFHEFKALTLVHLGAVSMDIQSGDLIEFDGQTLRYGGAEYTIPTIRAAIKAGWLVLSSESDNVSAYRPKPGGVKVRPAQNAGQERGEAMSFAAATEEESVVGTLGAHQDRTAASRREQSGSGAPTQAAQHEAPRAAAPRPVAQRAPVETTIPEDVSPIERRAVEEADRINRERIAAVLAQPLPPRVEYDDEEEPVQVGGYQVISSEDQGGAPVKNYRFSSGAAVGAEGDRSLREPTTINKMRVGSGPVGEPTPQERPLRSTEIPAKGNTDIHHKLAGGATGDVSVTMSGDDLTDLLPDAATGPVLDPNINWDKSAHWRTRVRAALDQYGSNPEMMEKIKSVESPGVVKAIEDEMTRR